MNSSLNTALARLERHIAERRSESPAPPASTRRGATPRPLPGDDPPRLFSDRFYRERPFRTALPVRLPGAPDRLLHYTGPQLARDDRMVWRWLLKLYRARGGDDQPIEFSASGLLRSLDWDTSRQGLDRLRVCLVRLQSATLGLTDAERHEIRYRSLIDDARCRQTPGGRSLRWQIRIAPAVRDLFVHD